MSSFFFRVKRRLAHYYLNICSFETWQKLGYHVMRKHYYSPVPDTALLGEEVFSRVSEMPGIKFDSMSQLSWIKEMSEKFRAEYDQWPKKPKNEFDFHISQTSFRCVDAHALYCMVRNLKPRKVIEIGSGYSTFITASACLKNKTESPAANCHFMAIEPYPNDVIKKGFPGLDEVVSKPVEKVPLEVFTGLNAGDILFIDSTHTVKTGGDVVYEILEILPRLRKGVFIHIHDIFFPYEYPKAWMADQRFWAEQYMIQAFLAFNPDYEIRWMSHFMHRNHGEELKELMDYYDSGTPYVSSLWIEKVK
jgi:hypothetical protein